MSFSFTPTNVDSSVNNMHHQQYMSPLTGSSSSSTGGSPTTAAQVQAAVAAQAAANMPLLTSIANVKDSRWLTLEVCREYQRGKCTRSEQECKFAHPPTHVEVNSGKVIACFDSLKGKCNRTNPPCKYLHPPQHLRDILLQNGRNNLILRSIAMNIAANQAIYPQTATHLSYPNGAIIQNPLQQPASIASYPHMGAAGPAQSTLVFNSAGQAFSIPLHAAHLQQMHQANATATMFSPDGTQYYQPVTQLAAQATGPKITRTDRLEVYSNHDNGKSYLDLDTLYQQQNASEDDGSYSNGFVSPYQHYPGQLQAIYAHAPSIDLKDSNLVNQTNISNGDTSSSTDTKAVIDPVSSSSITQQTKKRPLEDDTATTGAYLQLPPGTQLINAPQYLQQQQKRSAVADPKTGIPMAAYPVTAFSYPSPSPLPMQFQQPYLTAVPMAFTGYTSHMPRL